VVSEEARDKQDCKRGREAERSRGLAEKADVR
jgi:hypothetical protein